MSNATANASLLAIEDFTWALEPLVRPTRSLACAA